MKTQLFCIITLILVAAPQISAQQDAEIRLTKKLLNLQGDLSNLDRQQARLGLEKERKRQEIQATLAQLRALNPNGIQNLRTAEQRAFADGQQSIQDEIKIKRAEVAKLKTRLNNMQARLAQFGPRLSIRQIEQKQALLVRQRNNILLDVKKLKGYFDYLRRYRGKDLGDLKHDLQVKGILTKNAPKNGPSKTDAARLQKLKAEHRSLQSRFGNIHPRVKAIKKQVDDLEKKLGKNTTPNKSKTNDQDDYTTIKNALDAKKAGYQKSIAKIDSEIQNLEGHKAAIKSYLLIEQMYRQQAYELDRLLLYVGDLQLRQLEHLKDELTAGYRALRMIGANADAVQMKRYIKEIDRQIQQQRR